jgi:hypothetical protein
MLLRNISVYLPIYQTARQHVPANLCFNLNDPSPSLLCWYGQEAAVGVGLLKPSTHLLPPGGDGRQDVLSSGQLLISPNQAIIITKLPSTQL